MSFTGKWGPQVAFLKAEPRAARPEYSPHPELFNAICLSPEDCKKCCRLSAFLLLQSARKEARLAEPGFPLAKLDYLQQKWSAARPPEWKSPLRFLKKPFD